VPSRDGFEKPVTLRRLNDDVIGLVRCEVDGSPDVLAFQERVIFEDFIERSAGPEKIEHIRDAHAKATNEEGPPYLPS
jgi:hypothetical protein